ncbi:MAG TPA: CoA transferase [Planctomycetota bacterium]|nr:CoA transferase [Planctomycetota bacterium]
MLDASRVLAGPYAAMMLGDLGHDVIKVERPGDGDQTRSWGPPWQDGQSAYYLSVNRNKRSVTLNLKSPEGQEIFRKLAAQSDVLLENFRPGELDAWGLGWDAMSRLNPRLVFCSITGYGQTGPWKDRPAYDLALQAETGWMSITGEPGAPPVRVGVAVIDLFTAHFAVQQILSALLDRERTGQGRRIDISMLDAAVASLTYMSQNVKATGEPPGRMGSRHPSIVPYQAFATQDGWMVVAVGSQAIWNRFCPAIGLPDLLSHPDFRDNPLRVQHRGMLEGLLSRIFASRPTAEWLERFREHEVPAAPVNDLRAAVELPARSPAVRLPPPALGEHTGEILRELGFDEAGVSLLRQKGAI